MKIIRTDSVTDRRNSDDIPDAGQSVAQAKDYFNKELAVAQHRAHDTQSLQKANNLYQLTTPAEVKQSKRKRSKGGPARSSSLTFGKAFTYANLGFASALGLVPSAAAACPPDFYTLSVRDVKYDLSYNKRQGILWWDSCEDARHNMAYWNQEAINRCNVDAAATAASQGASIGVCDTSRMVTCGEGPANIWMGYLVRQYFCKFK